MQKLHGMTLTTTNLFHETVADVCSQYDCNLAYFYRSYNVPLVKKKLHSNEIRCLCKLEQLKYINNLFTISVHHVNS